CLQSFSSPFTF
nr:immunoglobulin light chain junction region [Macaca mulatta]